MKQSKLSNFLRITEEGNIILPIDNYEFELSPKAAENMVVALRGALRHLTQHALDGGYAPANEQVQAKAAAVKRAGSLRRR